MARAFLADRIDDSTGRPIIGASVTVREPGTTNPLVAVMYAGPTGGTTKANPLTTDGAGRFEFYLDTPQAVDLYVTAPGMAPATVRAYAVSYDTPAPSILSSPTINTPTVAGGTITGATISGGTHISPSWVAPQMTAPSITSGALTIQPGGHSAPGIVFADDPDLGIYRQAADTLAISTGLATDHIRMGRGSPNGLVAAFQGFGQANGATYVADKFGLSATQGVYGSSGGFGSYLLSQLVNNHEKPGLNVTSVVNTGTGGADGAGSGSHKAVEIREYVLRGRGGFLGGLEVLLQAEHKWGFEADGTTVATGVPKSMIAGTFQSRALAGLGGSQSVTGLLVTARGENDGDLVQGMEIVVAGRADADSTPSQRLGLIIATQDPDTVPARSKRGTSIDAHIVLARKAAAGAGDWTQVQPWLQGIHLGVGGYSEAWPYKSDSAFVRADPNLAAGTISDGSGGLHGNVIGSLFDMSNTRVSSAFIKGGAGETANVLDFSGITCSGDLIRLGSGGGLKFRVTGPAGWIGIQTNPTAPISIATTNASLMSFVGSSFVSATATAGTSGATPLQVDGYLNLDIGGTAIRVPYYRP